MLTVGAQRRSASGGLKAHSFIAELNAIQWLLFENRIALLTTLALVQFGLLWAWARWRTRRTQRMAVGGFVLACLLLAMQSVVVTDREEITAICRQIAHALEHGDIEGFGRHVSAKFSADSIDRDTLLAALVRTLEQVQVEEPRLSGFEVSTEGPKARAEFQARCRVITSEFIQGARLSRWELLFAETANGWQVIAIRPIPIPSFPFRTLPEVLGRF